MTGTDLTERLGPESLIVSVEGRRLHVALWGDAGKPAVMLLHGMRDHCRSWDWIARALADRYHVIAPDLRGHGDSDWAGPSGYAIPSYVLDIADIAGALDLDRYAIVGHSLGGVVGLRVAAAYPDKVAAFAGVECIELPIVRDEHADPKPFPVRLRQWIERHQSARQQTPRHYATIEDARERMQREQPGLDGETIDHLVRHALVAQAGGGCRWKFDHAARLRPPEDQHAMDLDQILSAISCPVLLTYGDSGWIPVPAPERLARIRDHRLVMFPGGTHWLHHEYRDRFSREVAAFLDTRFRPRPEPFAPSN